jgi:hypothetical protein
MPTYSRPPDDVAEVDSLIADVVSAHHPDLAEAGVTYDILFSYSKSGGPALKLHGYPCAAIVKINSYELRAKGAADVTLKIDGDDWPDWDEDRRRALIDHECQHIIIKRDRKSGEIKTDDAGRPKLGMRLHDLVLGGFAVIAERHGPAAFEVRAAEQLRTEYGQLLWDFGDASREPASGRARKARPLAVTG